MLIFIIGILKLLLCYVINRVCKSKLFICFIFTLHPPIKPAAMSPLYILRKIVLFARPDVAVNYDHRSVSGSLPECSFHPASPRPRDPSSLQFFHVFEIFHMEVFYDKFIWGWKGGGGGNESRFPTFFSP